MRAVVEDPPDRRQRPRISRRVAARRAGAARMEGAWGNRVTFIVVPANAAAASGIGNGRCTLSSLRKQGPITTGFSDRQGKMNEHLSERQRHGVWAVSYTHLTLPTNRE